MAQLPADQVPRLKLKWAFGFPGVNRAFAQPTVVGGRVFVGSARHGVLAERRQRVPVPGRSRPTLRCEPRLRSGRQRDHGGRWIAYFGDQSATSYAVDALTGELVVETPVDEFIGAIITGAPTLADGTLYVATSSAEEVIGANPKYECCKFRGSVSALNAATGEVRWKSYTIPEEPKPVRKN